MTGLLTTGRGYDLCDDMRKEVRKEGGVVRRGEKGEKTNTGGNKLTYQDHATSLSAQTHSELPFSAIQYHHSPLTTHSYRNNPHVPGRSSAIPHSCKVDAYVLFVILYNVPCISSTSLFYFCSLSLPLCLIPSTKLVQSSDTLLLPLLLFQTIQQAAVDTRTELYKHIVLSGGSSMYPGFPSRLEKEMKQLYLTRVLANDTSRLKVRVAWDQKLLSPTH